MAGDRWEGWMADDSRGLKEVLASEILEKIHKGEAVEYDHVIIKGDLEVGKRSLPKRSEKFSMASQIKITRSQIEGDANFGYTLINEPIDFSDTIFSQGAFCQGAKFIGEVNFNGSRFSADALFVGARFHKDARFIGAKFCQGAHFTGAKFLEESHFNGATFIKSASFILASFFKYADFHNAKFGEDVTFDNATFGGSADFIGASFNKTAEFDKATFSKGRDFSRYIVDSDAGIIKKNFRGGANFSGSQFGGDLSFNKSHFNGDAYFNESKFTEPIDFQGSKFAGTLNLENIYFNIIHIEWDSIRMVPKKFDYKLYLSLIENYKTRGFFEDADNCYYQYRNACRLTLTTPYKEADWVIMALYGYGVRPLRPLVGFLIVFVAFGLAYSYLGVAENSTWSGFNASLVLCLSGTKLFEDPTHPATQMLYWAFTTEKLLASLFFALFLVSVGKTLIR